GAFAVFSSHSTRPSPRAGAWAYLSAARSSKPTADGCWRSRANRRVLSFSLRSLPPDRTDRDRVDVALWHFSDMARCLTRVRNGRKTGHHWRRAFGFNLALRISA